ncbi:MoaD/ThiS family protein [Candidatus Lokiarchaeum ossiferum]|uniref:MoaD/ThiS family protein n=1 Tax=Candidatus Lokiarchaeum ossiferum TaxID=2951803 RepID=UPI00352D0C29
MVGLEKLNEISSMTTYRVKDASKVYDVIQKLNIETKYFAILVNGQKADTNMQIERNDEILVLPKISGGN